MIITSQVFSMAGDSDTKQVLGDSMQESGVK